MRLGTMQLLNQKSIGNVYALRVSAAGNPPFVTLCGLKFCGCGS